MRTMERCRAGRFDDPAERDDRPGELHHVGVEGDELSPTRDAAVQTRHFAAAEPEHQHHGKPSMNSSVGQSMPMSRTSCRLRGMYSWFAVSKEANLGFFLHIGTDQAGTGKVFLGPGGDIGEHGLDALEALVDAAAESTGSTMLATGSGRNAKNVSLGLMRQHEAQRAAVNTSVLARYMMAGPSSMRTALRSLVMRAMMSPVRCFW